MNVLKDVNVEENRLIDSAVFWRMKYVVQFKYHTGWERVAVKGRVPG